MAWGWSLEAGGAWTGRRCPVLPELCPRRLCGFEPFYDERGDQFMFRRVLNCEYYFISPWWDEVSLNAKDLVSVAFAGRRAPQTEALHCDLPSGCVSEWSAQGPG